MKLSGKSISIISNLQAEHPLSDAEKSDPRNSIENHTNSYAPLTFKTNKRKRDHGLNVPLNARKAERLKASRQKLPIYAQRKLILDTISENPIVIISGKTGSGKTTQVPQYILEDSAAQSKYCRIICTQPRRLAATSIAERVSEERNDRIGRSVGYQIRLDSCVSADSNLIYTTSGYLLQCLTGSHSNEIFSRVTHLVLDEVHEREKITDFLLIVIKEGLRTHRHMKIILMSATIDSEVFSDYFFHCPVINVPGRKYVVNVMYVNEIVTMINYYYMSLLPPHCINHDLLYQLIEHLHVMKPKDETILVFLPGYQDIMTQKSRIMRDLKKDVQLIILHSEMEANEYEMEHKVVFRRVQSSRRKIILSTNIAETSLTIDDVVHVIDAGKVKQQTYNSISDTTCLSSTWVSQACAKQRAGRAGRVRNGHCYRMYSYEQYERMDKYSLPEIVRVPLTEICLNARMLSGVQSIESFLLKAVQPPPIDNIRQGINLLKKIDALDPDENVTHLGALLVGLPVDVQFGKCVLYAVVLECINPVVTIVSAMSVQNLFTLPTSDEQQQKMFNSKRDYADGSLSDHQMVLNLYNDWIEHVNSGDDSTFCKENHISRMSMTMIRGIRKLLFKHLEIVGICREGQLTRNEKNWTVITACLTAGFYPNICFINHKFERIYSQSNHGFNVNVTPHPSSTLYVENSRNDKIDPNLFASEAAWCIHGGKTSSSHHFTNVRSISVVSPISIILFAGTYSLNNRTNSGVSDSNSKIVKKTYFIVDHSIKFSLNSREADLLSYLRQKFYAIFAKFIKNPSNFVINQHERQTLSVLIDVITRECGFSFEIETWTDDSN